MIRIWITVAALLIFLPTAAVATEQPAADVELQIELSDGESPQPDPPPAPQAPPLPPESRAPVAVQKIGDGKEPDIKAASAILVDAETGQILYSRKPHYRRPVASTTKIMTALLVLKYCDLDGYVTASGTAAKVPHSSLHLQPGERLTVNDMLMGMMLRSANDAAHAFAEHVSGSVSRFSTLMNKKAALLGLKDTHFKNPHGLYIAGHYSTAYDLSVLAREGVKNPDFNRIAGTRSTTIKRSKNTKDVAVASRTPFWKYPGADGIKSGYTKQAGYCYVGSATQGGWRLVSVVLKSDNASRDSMALMDYGFKNFQRIAVAPREQSYPVKVAGGKKKVLPAFPEQQLNVVVAKGVGQEVTTRVAASELRAPLGKGQRVGEITAYVDGVPVRAVSLLAGEDMDQSVMAAAWPWLRWLLGMVLAATILLSGGRRLSRGRAPAKNTRIRGRRLTQAMRRADPGR